MKYCITRVRRLERPAPMLIPYKAINRVAVGSDTPPAVVGS